jgi:hypothetical protein
MTPDAAERLRVYQEGQRSARTEDAECPYRQSDWRSRTWFKGRVAAMEYHKARMLEAAEYDRRAAIDEAAEGEKT